MDHNTVSEKRLLGSGEWFLKSDSYQRWLDQGVSFLWLFGFPGSGKSTLCSTVIDHTIQLQNEHREVGLAFFYFSFNDVTKQDASGMVRALLVQLAGQNPQVLAELARLRSEYTGTTPPMLVFLKCLNEAISYFSRVFIFLDGLDECPAYGARESVLETIDTIRRWELRSLNVLVTSRDVQDIRNSLNLTPDQQISMSIADVHDDITKYILTILHTDSRLKRLLDANLEAKIVSALSVGAQGMYVL